MSMARWAALAVLLTLFSLATGGCWDRLEVDERLYGLAVGVDLLDAEGPPDKDVRRPTGKLRLATEIGIWGAMAGGGEGGGDTGGLKPPKPFWLITSTGDTLSRIVEQYDKRSFRSLTWGHLKVIVIGEEVARKNLRGVLDYFTRQREMRRPVKFIVAEGEAREVLKVQTKIDKLVSLTLPRLIAVTRDSNRSIDMSIGEVVTHMSPEMGFLTPRVRKAEGELVVGGLAAFRGHKLVGWLGETETKGATILTNMVNGGVVEFHRREGGNRASFRIRQARAKWRPHVKGERISFTVDIIVRGDLDEWQIPGMKPENVREAEREIGQEIRRETQAAIRASKRLRADLFKTGEIIAGRYPKVWKKTQNRWNDRYADEVDIKINKIEVIIHQVGQAR